MNFSQYALVPILSKIRTAIASNDHLLLSSSFYVLFSVLALQFTFVSSTLAASKMRKAVKKKKLRVRVSTRKSAVRVDTRTRKIRLRVDKIYAYYA